MSSFIYSILGIILLLTCFITIARLSDKRSNKEQKLYVGKSPDKLRAGKLKNKHKAKRHISGYLNRLGIAIQQF